MIVGAYRWFGGFALVWMSVLVGCASTCGGQDEVEFVGPLAGTSSEAEAEDREQDARVVRLVEGFEPNPGEIQGQALAERDTGELRAPAPFSACEGWLPEEPQHVLVLDRFIDFSVRADAPPNASLLLVIEGVGRTWCAAGDGGRAVVRSSFTEGEYTVRVGLRSRGEPVPYTLSWQHVEEAQPDFASLDSETPSVAFQGTAGGPRLPETFPGDESWGDCQGFYPGSGQHQLTIDDDTSVRLQAQPGESGSSLRLILHGPEGALCLPPAASGAVVWQGELTEGTWSLHVGTEDGSSRPYELTVRR